MKFLEHKNKKIENLILRKEKLKERIESICIKNLLHKYLKTDTN